MTRHLHKKSGTLKRYRFFYEPYSILELSSSDFPYFFRNRVWEFLAPHSTWVSVLPKTAQDGTAWFGLLGHSLLIIKTLTQGDIPLFCSLFIK
ncbi:MAG: hypothetical protein CSA33_05005 [Desulfobulbus propionicus]|nr:MAG: hypothetical protein CSA33_05005 [Desulfobulbus propionicus]